MNGCDLRKNETNFIKTTIREFLYENYDKTLLSEIVDDEIKVYETAIRKLLGSVGDGIYSIDVESRNMGGKYAGYAGEYQNEISIYFNENARGGIGIDEWNMQIIN